MKPLATNPREVLLDAIQSEIESRALLQKLATRAASEDVRKRLLELADREITHRAKMESRYREVVGEDPPGPQPVQISLSDDLGQLDMRRALKIVLERERDAESNYRFLAERVPNTELGGLFLELAELEWKHKVEIQVEYDRAASSDPDDFLADL